MKIFLILPVILSAVLGKSRALPTIVPFKSVSVSPLYYGKDTTFLIESGMFGLQIKFVISNDLFQDKEIYSNTFFSAGNFRVTYNNEFTRPTNQIYIKYKIRTVWYSTEKITLKPATNSYKNLVDNQPFSSRSKVSVFTFSSLTWSSDSVNYTFQNFDGLHIPDYYQKIKLDEFLIKVSSEANSLFKCDPSLVITNVNGVFNDISTSSSVEFPLTLKSTSNGYTFELKDIIYVHKETMMLSIAAKPGYVPTKHIYLPRNDMQNQDKYKAYLVIQNFGIDNDLVRHSFELRALKNIIGDCQNSEYCIQRL